jgi:hypothetical protein
MGPTVESAQGPGTTGVFDSFLQNKATVSASALVDESLDPAKQLSDNDLDPRTRYYLELAESEDLDDEARQSVELSEASV